MTIQRFKTDGTDRAMMVLSEERIAGKRAPYHVYYKTARGKAIVQAAYQETAASASAWLSRNVRGAVILGVLPTVSVTV